ncbi:MAG: fructose 1,6-bisphosphatase [Candidatus Korarchaeota archaeon]|nr:fructose 1,6-bisphosphatase [Candidatus Korarchaeota archaeon]NIU83441.1 fructose 1,6-bisphosphatase [Candidatus Thorarchaeota archaeon]NIW13717.1 fructose 1,6-bisphosphatase [Candidatus Thorarchaeota archaeon]NIW51812.1 fructose 1,6-bisphosphatase [Candidatus Korarchaeota archaeon]
MEKITISAIKADVGGQPGHVTVPKPIIELANEEMQKAKQNGELIDAHVFHAGDDLELLMTHKEGVNSSTIHELALNTFKKATEKAKGMKLYGAGQDLLKETFSGNIRGMGPGIAEMEFPERKSEPLLVFAADKTDSGAFNLPLYKIFGDPFNTAGLVIDSNMHDGFEFTVLDVKQGREITLQLPEQTYDLLALIGSVNRFVIKKVFSKNKTIAKGPCAVSSTQKLSKIAGSYVGKDDPVCIVRSQHGLPAVGEVLEGFSLGHLVEGWMRGSHFGPLMPVSQENAKCTRFDGPPRVVGLGFQLVNGRLSEPLDLFDDPAFEETRRRVQEIADYLRRHGPFEPHRAAPESMEYTTLPDVLAKLEDEWKEV